MSKRIGLVALAALCAVALSAVAASGASAAGTTAFTCLEGGTGFGDADCSTAGSGFHKEAIPAGESTQLTVTAIGTATTLKAKIAGANTTLTATEGVECVGCMAENTEVAGHMQVSGSGGVLVYKGVTISTAGCEVVGKTVTTEPLRLTTFAEGELARAEIAPESGSVEAVVHTQNKGAETCPLPAEIKVEGLAKGTATGAKAAFATTTTGTSELHIGTSNASLKGELTISAGLTGGTHHTTGLEVTGS